MDALAEQGIGTESVRLVDHDVRPGVNESGRPAAYNGSPAWW
jgi:hypothetical protein